MRPARGASRRRTPGIVRYAHAALSASAKSIAPKVTNVLLSAAHQRFGTPFAGAVGNAAASCGTMRGTRRQYSLEVFAELRAQEGFFVRHDRRVDARPSKPSDAANERGAQRRPVFSGKSDREAGRGNEVAEIERVAHVSVRTGRHELRRGHRVVARRLTRVADRPAAKQFAGERERQAERDAGWRSASRDCTRTPGRQAQQAGRDS